MLRPMFFNLYFYAITFWFAVTGLPLIALPSNRPLAWWIHRWSLATRWGLKVFAGITIEFRGLEHANSGKARILAAKHQSYADAIILYSQFPSLAAVAMKELASVPIAGLVFRKLKMIMVDRHNGSGGRHLAKGAERAVNDGRPILIYPEGQIPPVGVRVPYKKGVWHLQQNHKLPVVPIATNLGLFWEQNKWQKKPGRAVIEFLPAIQPGMAQAVFMAELEARIEERTSALLAEDSQRDTSANVESPKDQERVIDWTRIPPIALTPHL